MQRLVVIVARISVAAIIVATLCVAGIVLYARSQGLLILSVQTGSMRPYVRPGDAVLVRSGQPSITELMPGDIVSYLSQDQPNVIITHRIVSIDRERNMLVAKGDTAETIDEPIPVTSVVGVVERPVPLVGYGFDFLRQPHGLAIAVYVPSLVLISFEVRRLMRHYTAQKYVVYYY